MIKGYLLDDVFGDVVENLVRLGFKERYRRPVLINKTDGNNLGDVPNISINFCVDDFAIFRFVENAMSSVVTIQNMRSVASDSS